MLILYHRWAEIASAKFVYKKHCNFPRARDIILRYKTNGRCADILKAENLTKTFGAKTAASDIGFELKPGGILGLLGPNGAGKTTTLNMLAGYLKPTSGTVYIDGVPLEYDRTAAARHIGFLPEIPPVYGEMTAGAFLNFVYELKGVKSSVRGFKRKHISDCAKLCEVGDVLGRVAGHLSRGYKQRLGFAAALIGDPDILILDEPTAGLDPRQIKETRELIAELGKTRAVIISTHILPEVTQLAGRVIVMHKGKIVADSPPSELKAPKAAKPRRELLNMMTPKEREIFELGVRQKTLEDVFMKLTAEEKGDER